MFDIRTLKEVGSFRGHGKDVTSMAWHPQHEGLFVSGGWDGTLLFWHVGAEGPQAETRGGHEAAIWSMAWHPLVRRFFFFFFFKVVGPLG